MYACGATRCDITYPVHLLCRCLTKPTPELLEECDYIFSYLSRHAKVGLNFSAPPSTLHGYSDASWETKNSTSGYVGSSYLLALAQARSNNALPSRLASPRSSLSPRAPRTWSTCAS